MPLSIPLTIGGYATRVIKIMIPARARKSGLYLKSSGRSKINATDKAPLEPENANSLTSLKVAVSSYILSAGLRTKTAINLGNTAIAVAATISVIVILYCEIPPMKLAPIKKKRIELATYSRYPQTCS